MSKLTEYGQFATVDELIARCIDKISGDYALKVTNAGVPKTLAHLKVTVAAAGTPQQVSATTVPCSKVYLSADTDAGKVLVVGGDNTVRATTGNKNGMILIPGNDVVVVEIDDLMDLWVDTAVNGGVLCVAYV